MERIEHTGKTWNCSFLTGRETRRVFRYVDKRTGEQVKGVGSFIGRLRDVTSGAEVGELECLWRENGDIEVVFPDMDAGRYEIVIDHSGQNGEIVRFLDGYAGYLEPGYVITGYEEGEEVVVTVCCGDGVHEVYALSGDLLKYSTEEAIEAMKRAEAARDEVLEQLELAMKFVASFDKALRDSIQVVNNYLWIGGMNTGHYLKGEDGETPRYGADGWWYIGDKRVGKARGDDGITPHITSDGYWAIGSIKTNVRAAGRDGRDGASMRRIRIYSLDELPKKEELGVYYYLKTDNGWDKYVWLHPDGWVCVGEVNDIATSEIYGLMKYATDEQVNNGAPVGTNADGQASVPLAGTTVAGAGRLSTGIEITFGAEVGFDANKAYRVPVATMDSYGVGRLGINTTVDGAHVGFDSDGRWCVPWATLYTAGVIKLGSQFGQSNPMPYIVGIGATKNHELANNYAFGGALQHRKPDGWRGTMAWLDVSMSQSQQYFGDMFYSGLLTSGQFTQSQNTGLELLPATKSTLAGVYLATSMNQTGAYALTGGVVVNYLSEHYYDKSVVYTKQETLTEMQTKLNEYVTLRWAQDNLMTRTEIMKELKKKLECPSGRVQNIEFLTASERQNLNVIDNKTAYLVYAG